jgi:hypothetical protein
MAGKAPKSASSPLPHGRNLSGSGSSAMGEPSSGDDPYAAGDPEIGQYHNGADAGASLDSADSENKETDQRPRRKKSWPKDKAKRLKQMAKTIPDYIEQYYGNSVAVAHAMKATVEDVEAVIASDPDLARLKEVSDNSREALLLDVVTHNAISNSKSIDARWLLERSNPDRYARKTAGKAKTDGKGFSAPKEKPAELESALGPSKD